MKNKIIFIIVFVAAISLGFYSVDIAELFFNYNDLKQMSIVRDRDSSDAIYIKSENETAFDPIELVRNDEPYSHNDEYEKSVICEAAIKGICQFDYSARFYDCQMDDDFRNSIKFTKNYIYMDSFKYKNYYGKDKYLDFIMTYDDLTLIYIRFYSEDESEADAAEIDNALKQFSRETEDFYNNYSNGDDHIFINDFNALFYDYLYLTHGEENIEKYAYKYGEYEIFDALTSAYLMAPYLISKYVKFDNPPFYNFWIINFIITKYELELKLFWGHVTGISNIISGISYNPRYSKPSYSIMNGKIYQSVYVGLYQVVVIYNIKEKCYEGFYAPQGRDYESNAGQDMDNNPNNINEIENELNDA